MKKQFLLIFLLFTCVSMGIAQESTYLDRLVSIKAGTYTYHHLFKSISAQTGVVFSYTKFNDLEKKTVQYLKKPLYVVLDDLFKNSPYNYKIKGKYVILTARTPNKTSETIAVNGYVYNAQDSSALKEVSVYIKQNKHVTTSKETGYFSLSFPAKSEQIVLSFAKENFKDTSLLIQLKNKDKIAVYLENLTIQISTAEPKINSDTLVSEDRKDTVVVRFNQEEIIKPQAFWKRFKDANFKNINDTFFTNVAFSLVPSISTNRLLAINTVNRLSFNILSGYSKGIDLLEIGALCNFDHGNVQYVQLAGLSNVVSGKVKGVQAAGLLNYNGNRTTAVQFAGLLNVNRYHSESAQFAGIGNCISGRYSGLQAAGIFNFNTVYSEGCQLAGIINFSPGYKGAQFAGIANVSWKDIHGAQFAGILNTADTVHGAQVSGLLNVARCSKGLQLGFINVSGSNSGIPIGFLSFVRKGYHKLEFAYDDQSFTSFSFRTGVDLLHNIFSVGLKSDGHYYSASYGLGTSLALSKSKKFFLNVDLSSSFMHQATANPSLSYNGLQRVFLGFEYRPLKKINIVAGPTANLFMNELANENYQPQAGNFFVDENHGAIRYRAWVGWKVALRIL